MALALLMSATTALFVALFLFVELRKILRPLF